MHAVHARSLAAFAELSFSLSGLMLKERGRKDDSLFGSGNWCLRRLVIERMNLYNGIGSVTWTKRGQGMSILSTR